MAWCKVSSLAAAVVRSMREVEFPAPRSVILAAADGKTVEGWELAFFLGRALAHERYEDLRSVVADLEGWLEGQG